jgi:hypothetical protein
MQEKGGIQARFSRIYLFRQCRNCARKLIFKSAHCDKDSEVFPPRQTRVSPAWACHSLPISMSR